MEFTVPDKEPTNEDIIECITVLDESPPRDLPGTAYFFFVIF
jgi:hypothetical protein